MGEKVAEEELGKSKIISLFEADITNKGVKTFYNGVAGVLEDRQRQDKIINEDKIFIIHPLSSFRYEFTACVHGCIILSAISCVDNIDYWSNIEWSNYDLRSFRHVKYFRLIWDTVLLAAIMIMMVVLPLKLSFFKIFDDKSREQERQTWYPIVIVLDLIFMSDVVASFFTGTIEQKQNPPLVRTDLRKSSLYHYYYTTRSELSPICARWPFYIYLIRGPSFSLEFVPTSVAIRSIYILLIWKYITATNSNCLVCNDV